MLICFRSLLPVCLLWRERFSCVIKVQTQDTMWKVCSVHMKSMQAKTNSDWWFMFIQMRHTGSGLIIVKWRVLICPLLPGGISIEHRSKMLQEAYRYVRCCYFWTLSMHRAEEIEWLSRCLKIKTSRYLPRCCTSQNLECSSCMSTSKGGIMKIWLILSSGWRRTVYLFNVNLYEDERVARTDCTGRGIYSLTLANFECSFLNGPLKYTKLNKIHTSDHAINRLNNECIQGKHKTQKWMRKI